MVGPARAVSRKTPIYFIYLLSKLEIFVFDLFKGAGTFIGAPKASLLAIVFPLPMQNVANANSPKKRFFLWLFLLKEGGGFAGPGGTVILLYYCTVTQGH